MHLRSEEIFLMHLIAPLQHVLSKMSFPVNWSTAREQRESRWAGAGSLTWLGNRPNVPCSAFPASQMDDDEVNGGQRRVCSPGDRRREENTLTPTSSWGKASGTDEEGETETSFFNETKPRSTPQRLNYGAHTVCQIWPNPFCRFIEHPI